MPKKHVWHGSLNVRNKSPLTQDKKKEIQAIISYHEP